MQPGGGGVGGFFLVCENFGRMFDHSFTACAFFIFSFFLVVEISSRALPLFMPRSVHSGSASWDDCGWTFPDKLLRSLIKHGQICECAWHHAHFSSCCLLASSHTVLCNQLRPEALCSVSWSMTVVSLSDCISAVDEMGKYLTVQARALDCMKVLHQFLHLTLQPSKLRSLISVHSAGELLSHF